MLGLIAPAFVAVVAALACGGSLRRLFDNRVLAWPAVVLAFAVELAVFNPPIDTQPWALEIGPWVWLLTRLVLLAVLLANGWPSAQTHVWPWRIAALGVCLNTLVIAANGGHMPQSPEAALAVWGASHLDPSRLDNVVAATADTRLSWLADVLVEPSWLPRRNVVSPGDLLLATGLASWVFLAAAPGRTWLGRRIVSRVATPIHGVARPQGRPTT
jgi:uncharacterized protein DUF5317